MSAGAVYALAKSGLSIPEFPRPDRQANLDEIGVNVQIDTHEFGTFWALADEDEGKGKSGLQMTYKWYWAYPDPFDFTDWFVPEQAGLWNWEYWENEEFGRLHEQAIAEGGRDKRRQMYVRMQELMAESGAYHWIMYQPQVALCRNTVKPAFLPIGFPVYSAFKPA